jgi:hypothetical protein
MNPLPRNALLFAAVLLTACNPTPNTAAKTGPSVQFNITNKLGTWPVSQGGNDDTGFLGIPTPKPTNVLSTQGIANGALFNIDPTNRAPNFDVLIGIIPGDASGVTQFSVNVIFQTTCNGAAPEVTKQLGSQILGAAGGAPLTNPFYLQELSTAQAQQQGCGGVNIPAPGSGTYSITVSSTNGGNFTSNFQFFVRAGPGPLPNNGPV